MSTNKDTDTPPLQDASAAFEQALQEKNQEHYLLKLYISGMTPQFATRHQECPKDL